MNQQDIDFLEANRHHHNMLVNAGQVRHLDGNTRSEMQRIISDTWIKGYSADLWCPQCCMEMLTLCYRLFDKWLSDQPKEEPSKKTKSHGTKK